MYKLYMQGKLRVKCLEVDRVAEIILTMFLRKFY